MALPNQNCMLEGIDS